MKHVDVNHQHQARTGKLSWLSPSRPFHVFRSVTWLSLPSDAQITPSYASIFFSARSDGKQRAIKARTSSISTQKHLTTTDKDVTFVLLPSHGLTTFITNPNWARHFDGFLGCTATAVDPDECPRLACSDHACQFQLGHLLGCSGYLLIGPSTFTCPAKRLAPCCHALFDKGSFTLGHTFNDKQTTFCIHDIPLLSILQPRGLASHISLHVHQLHDCNQPWHIASLVVSGFLNFEKAFYCVLSRLTKCPVFEMKDFIDLFRREPGWCQFFSIVVVLSHPILQARNSPQNIGKIVEQ